MSIKTELSPGNSSADWTTWLVHDRRLLILIVGLVVVAGLSSVMVLPRMEDPVLTRRVAIVNTFLPGADAALVESLVTEKLEDSLRDIEEVKEMRSISRPGNSSIVIELVDKVTQSDTVWSRVRSKIEDALPKLPVQATRPQFEELEVRAYARIVSVVWDRPGPPDYSVLRRTARRLQDTLQVMPGTETVDRFSDPGEEIVVRVDPQQAAATGLTADSIARQLASQDAKNAAGQVRGEQIDLSLEVQNQFDDLSHIARADVRASDGRFVRLSAIADIRLESPSPLPRLGRHNQQDAITLGVLIRPEVRIDLWKEEADRVIGEFSAGLPSGIHVERVMDQSGYVMERLNSLLKNLAMGGLAVCVVILLMMGWRSAVVVASALPLTVLAVLFGFRILDIPIHQMSVTGLIIALGLLIDNAIVVADEIQMEMAHGLPPTDAVSVTIRKLAVPLLGSTLTTAFAFAPIALMPGPAGEFVGSIAISVILAVFASLVFSLTVIAAFAAIFIRVSPANPSGRMSWFGFLQTGWSPVSLSRIYRAVLLRLFERPWLAIGLAMIVPIAGFYAATMLDEQFFPPTDRDQFHIEVELATGSSIDDTQRIAAKIDAVLENAGVEQVDWFFGDSAPAFYYNVVADRKGQPNFGQAIIRIEADANVADVIRHVQKQVDRNVPQARVLVRQLEQGPPFDAPLEIRLFGPDLDLLREYGEQVRSILASVPSVTHTSSLLSETLPKLSLDVDAQGASLAGLSPSDIAAQVQGALDGRTGGSVIQEMEELPVRVRMNDRSRRTVRGVRSLELVTEFGDLTNVVPLNAVAKLSLEPETGVIVRLNRRRMNEIGGYLTAGTLPARALTEFRARLAASGFEMPAGYELAYGGEASKRNDAVGNLMASVGVLAAMMIATLVLSFGSFRLATIIGIVGILSIGAGVGSVWIAGYPFGFVAIIGTMGLIGVAINDSIVVLTSLQQTHGNDPVTASDLVDTVAKCTRHVIATTLTTVAGFTPLILGGGQFWPPLAVAISGGVVVATGLALVFVPAAFRIVYCRKSGILKAEGMSGQPAPLWRKQSELVVSG